MAKETVQAVRQAEINSIEKEKEALQKRTNLISEAEQSAKELINSLTKQGLDKAERDLKEAGRKGTELINTSKMKAESEILIMKELAIRKEDAAINLILSKVIQ